ncbi:hypothetical protein ACWDA9_42210, partial [Streptomyces sp. NPDC001193]
LSPAWNGDWIYWAHAWTASPSHPEAHQQRRTRALMALATLLDDADQSEAIRRAAGEMRFRIGSRLA